MRSQPNSNRALTERKLRIVKLTPIALALCEACNAQFQSYERVEHEAEHEMRLACLASTISSGQRRLFFPTLLLSISAVEAVGKW